MKASSSQAAASTRDHTVSSKARSRQQAVILNKLLAHTSRAHQQRFLKQMKAEAAQASDFVGLKEEKQLSAMLAERHRKLHMLKAVKRAPLKYSEKWT